VIKLFARLLASIHFRRVAYYYLIVGLIGYASKVDAFATESRLTVMDKVTPKYFKENRNM